MSTGGKGKPLQLVGKSEPKPERICPRCGQPYNWLEKRTIGDRTYLIAVHVVNGVREICYLGPVGGYKIGAKTHPFLQLTGFGANPREEFERRLEYLDENVRGLLKLASTEEDRRRVLEALERATRMAKDGAGQSMDPGGGG
jgi:hypothetical protein